MPQHVLIMNRYADRDAELIKDILDTADRIGANLARLAAALDQHAGSVADVNDRGALTRLQRLAHDTMLAIRYAKLPGQRSVLG